MPLRRLLHDLLGHPPSSPTLSPLLPQRYYFESIDQLATWEGELSSSGDTSAVTEPVDNAPGQTGTLGTYSGIISKDRSKLLVCHDFKGGYTEDPFERGYSLEFWHLVDTFIYFSHKRITLPPRGWLDAGHRHGSKVLGTVIFEWAESKPDLGKCLYGGTVLVPVPGMNASVADMPFSTVYASQLIRLAKARNLDGYLLNIETDLNFLPPASCYPDGSQRERDEDATFLERERSLAGLGAVINAEVQQRRERRMRRNASALSRWVGWIREEGKRLVGPQWEIIWYDSVTTAGRLEWQDALTTANAPFFVNSDAIFTNYTWARPPDPAPPGGLQESTGLIFKPHPALLTSANMAESLGRSSADVYIGIDVFGRNCYGGYEVGRSLDMIFPSHHREHTEFLNSSGPSSLVPDKNQKDLGLSVALFAPGWTWEREKDGGGDRSWSEWWDDDLRFWVGTGITQSPQESSIEGHAIGSYFGPRAHWSHHPLPLLLPSQTDLLGSTAPIIFPPDTHSNISISEDGNAQNATTHSFYTNFNRGSGHSWWVRGGKVYDASSPANDPAGKLGWTDIGACFPKPDRIWPQPALLKFDPEDTMVSAVKALNFSSPMWHGQWIVDRAALIDYEAWQGGTSLEIALRLLLEASVEEPIFEHTPTSISILPMCTLNARHTSSFQSTNYSLEVVIKPLTFPDGISDIRELQLRPYVIWASRESNEACSYYVPRTTSGPADIHELENGWYSTTVTVQPYCMEAVTCTTSVPVVALGMHPPRSISRNATGVSTDLRFFVGEIILSALPEPGSPPSLPPRTAVGSPSNDTPSDPEIVPLTNSNIGKLRWEGVPPPSAAPPTSLWGLLTWDVDGAQLNSFNSLGYFNIFASILRTRDPSGNDHTGNSIDHPHVWLGTSTYGINSTSFIVAGLEPSSLVPESYQNMSAVVNFCVLHVGPATRAIAGNRVSRGSLFEVDVAYQ